MEEKNLVKCKICKELKSKIMSGKYPNNKDVRWIDEDGSQWSGKVCPSCHRDRNKQNQKIKRAHQKLDELA